MDERQTKIREGAGLEESRLNQDFIDLLQKWSMPALVVIAVAAVGYAGWDRYKKAVVEKIDRAFLDYESAAGSTNPSPDSLRRVADEFEGVKSVPLLARLKAADAYLAAIRAGVKPGSEIKPDGSLTNPADALTPEDRSFNLAQANGLYQRVLDEASAAKGKDLFALQALYGLAAVAESEAKYDDAKAFYERIEKLVTGGQFAVHAEIAKERIADMEALKAEPKLWTTAELPPAPDEPPPAPPAPVEGTPAEGAPATTPTTDTPATPLATPPAEPAPTEPKPEAPKDPAPATPPPAEPAPK